ncbi:MAG TPA: hypothetical protein VGU66_05960 [Candidatus Elarobacter sp.]|nr:hypothetical protein [Candidatus Elarobacter sp.]
MMFAQEVALLSYFVVRAARTADTDGDAGRLHAQVRGAYSQLDDERLDDDTRFLFDVIARQNEGIVQNIDTLDNGLIAVAVGIIAVTLFAADKWFDLDPILRFAGFFFLIESAVIALLGYLAVSFVGPGTADVVRLRDFAVDFSESAAEATASAIAEATRSAELNVVARRSKRAFIILATILAIVAAGLIVAAARLASFRSTSRFW